MLDKQIDKRIDRHKNRIILGDKCVDGYAAKQQKRQVNKGKKNNTFSVTQEINYNTNAFPQNILETQKSEMTAKYS